MGSVGPRIEIDRKPGGDRSRAAGPWLESPRKVPG
jgi:hypothetical protein